MSINSNNNLLNEILSTIDNLPTSKEEQEKSITIAESGITEVVPDTNKTLSKVTINVDVEQGKEEQEKSITIADNGTTEVTPDEGKTLSKVTVNVEVEQSGSDDFIGIKYSNFSGKTYNLPKTADARSLDKILKEPISSINMENDSCLNYAFANINKNGNGGYFVQLEEVYLPTKATTLYCTFDNCINLTTIHGDLSNITGLTTAFRYCTKLDVNALIARMPNLKVMQNNCFAYCTQITEITLPATITLLHTGAFTGCTNIEKVTIHNGWNVSLYLHHSEKLTQESLHAMIENLADMTGSTTTMYFRVGSTNIAKIDEEHITMLENKNWTYQ